MKLWRLKFTDGRTVQCPGGLSDYTLCGNDTAGDPSIYRKEPELIDAKRITCKHCLEIIQIVKNHIEEQSTH